MKTSSKGPQGAVLDWAALPPGEHLVQVYRDESAFLDLLEQFVAGALAAGDAVVVIATAAHRSSLAARMRGQGLAEATCNGRYLALDAADTLSRFMVDGMPDRARFEATLDAIMAPARHGGFRVRAFGEMVALLWTQGFAEATLELEQLWSSFCAREGVTLFCAYPRIGATRDLGDSLAEVCALHSRVLPAD
jgi:hypothetical protein